MDWTKAAETAGMIAAVAMPLCNIPLILKIVRRKSSRDLSLLWVTGVWVCVMGMLPSSLLSADRVLRAFGVVNAALFSAVFIVVLKYRKNDPS